MRIAGSVTISVRRVGELASKLNEIVQRKGPDDRIELDLRLDGKNVAILVKEGGNLRAIEELGRHQ